VVEAVGPFDAVIGGPSTLARWRRSFLFRPPRRQLAHEKWHRTPGPPPGDRSEKGPGRISDVESVPRESLVIIDMKELETQSRCATACMRADRLLGQM
jgi:hypothetical protein